jgi:hypothetical protein
MVQWANQGKSTGSIVMLGFLALMAMIAALIVASIDYSLKDFSVPKPPLRVLAKFSFLLGLLIVAEFAFTGGLAFEFENYNVVAWIFQACLVVNLWFAANKSWKDLNS